MCVWGSIRYEKGRVRLVDSPRDEGGREGGREGDLTVCVSSCVIILQSLGKAHHRPVFPKKTHLDSFLGRWYLHRQDRRRNMQIHVLCRCMSLALSISCQKCNKAFNL